MHESNERDGLRELFAPLKSWRLPDEKGLAFRDRRRPRSIVRRSRILLPLAAGLLLGFLLGRWQPATPAKSTTAPFLVERQEFVAVEGFGIQRSSSAIELGVTK